MRELFVLSRACREFLAMLIPALVGRLKLSLGFCIVGEGVA